MCNIALLGGAHTVPAKKCFIINKLSFPVMSAGRVPPLFDASGGASCTNFVRPEPRACWRKK
jgi:hypothetical protein